MRTSQTLDVTCSPLACVIAQREGKALPNRTQPARHGRDRSFHVCYPVPVTPCFAHHGPLSDMSLQENIFSSVIERFGAEQEEIRTAASFAAGEP